MAETNTSMCTFDGCERPHMARGLCNTHYAQLRKGGPLRPITPRDLPLKARFFAKVVKSEGCWEWIGSKTGDGYGRIVAGGRNESAHRVSYEMHTGEIPAGHFVDHICHNRGCVNPAHLRLATNKQNCQYRKGPNRNNASSGIRGVYRYKYGWQASVYHNGKSRYLGTYPTSEEAEAAVVRERARLFDFPEVIR